MSGLNRGWISGLWAGVCLLAAVVLLAGATLPAPEAAAPARTAEEELEAIVQLDDLVHEEIEQWLSEGETNRVDVASRAALNLKIKQRREMVQAAYEKFVQRHPENARARLLWGSFLRECGRDKEAVAQWEEARRLAPTNAAAWNNLGNYYAEEGPATNAFTHYARAMELAPKEPLYAQQMARCLLVHEEEAAAWYGVGREEVIRKAQEHLRRACGLAPTNFALATELAQTYYLLKVPLTGDRRKDWQAAQQLTDEALAAWEAAGKLAGTEVERQGVLVHRARILISAERWAEARRTLEQIKEPSLAGLKVELEARLAAREKAPEAPAAPAPK
ncbi:tetratricopeptide repeat protein [Fontisphaera persica]|uniref:tetratricopeptide repeat protein n=1 Tax=Fontisphaera persica TaxID=2974023 RepID=UPI0024C02A7C|nr:tetratricopeptide repeat protein [Fontisphaera persica]WCJ59314.1 tetratricopeptide repeat protein [Fontisphaera persica]